MADLNPKWGDVAKYSDSLTPQGGSGLQPHGFSGDPGYRYQPVESGRQLAPRGESGIVPRGAKTTRGPDAKVTGDWFKNPNRGFTLEGEPYTRSNSKALVPQQQPISRIKGIPARTGTGGFGAGLKGDAIGALNKIKNIPMASKIGGLGTAISVADEAINTAKDFQSGGLSNAEKIARVSEGAGRLASAGAGGGMGFQAGVAAAPFIGPFAPLAPIAGGAIGAGLGYLAPEAARDIGRRLGFDVNLPSDIANENRSSNTPNQRPVAMTSEGETSKNQNNTEQSPRSNQPNPMLAAIRQNQQNLNAGYSSFLDQAAQMRGLEPEAVRGGLTGVLNEDEQRQVRRDLINTPSRQTQTMTGQDGANTPRGYVTAQGQPGGPYTGSNARFQGLSGADETRPAMIRNSTNTENIGVDLGRGNYMMASRPDRKTSAGMQRVSDYLQRRGGLEGLHQDQVSADQRAAEDRANLETLARDSLIRQLRRASTNQDYQGVGSLTQGLQGLQNIDAQRQQGQLTQEQQGFTQELARDQFNREGRAQEFEQNMKLLERKDGKTARKLADFTAQAQLDAYNGDMTKLEQMNNVVKMMNNTPRDQWGQQIFDSLTTLASNQNAINQQYAKAMQENNLEKISSLEILYENNLKMTEFYSKMGQSLFGKEGNKNG